MNDNAVVDIRPDHLQIVQNILHKHLQNNITVWVFGSRATWQTKDSSDLDLALEGQQKIEHNILLDLESDFEQSDLPWRVDIVDTHAITPTFAKIIDKDKVKLPTLHTVKNNSTKQEKLPEGWREVRLGDVANYRDEKVFTSDITQDDYISTDNMLANLGGVTIADKIPSSQKVKKINPKDVLFSNIRTYFRKVYYATRNGGCSNDVLVFQSCDNINSKFLYYVLADNTFIDYSDITSKGTKMPRGDKSAIMQYDFNLPPLPEQKAIARILGSLDDKIELNRQMNKTLEAMAQALFKSWFINFDPVIDNALQAGNPIPDKLQKRANKRKNLNPALKTLPPEITKLFPNEFEHHETMGWIPKGWEVKKTSAILQINPSIKLGKGQVASYVDMKALPKTGYSISDVVNKAFTGGSKFQNGDVLLARITPCLQNGKTGVVDFLSNKCSVGFGSTEFIVIRGKQNISTEYIACLARYHSFRKHCEKSMIGSSGRQRVQNSCFESYYLTLPVKEPLLQQFKQFTYPIFQKISKQSKQKKTLTQLRDILLPKLISGKIRIGDSVI